LREEKYLQSLGRVSRKGSQILVALLVKGFVSGHDFSRAADATKRCRTLAPELFVFSYAITQRLKPESEVGTFGTTEVMP
jgi:hypothetical protein